MSPDLMNIKAVKLQGPELLSKSCQAYSPLLLRVSCLYLELGLPEVCWKSLPAPGLTLLGLCNLMGDQFLSYQCLHKNQRKKQETYLFSQQNLLDSGVKGHLGDSIYYEKTNTSDLRRRCQCLSSHTAFGAINLPLCQGKEMESVSQLYSSSSVQAHLRHDCYTQPGWMGYTQRVQEDKGVLERHGQL